MTSRQASMPAQPPAVRRGYRLARAMTARAGRTYYLASALLPAADRCGVFALYGFARMVDDVVDGPGEPASKAAAIDALESGLHAALGTTSGEADLGDDQLDVLAALADTVSRFAIPVGTFDEFLASMRMDVPGTPAFRNRYRTLAELTGYMRGSAAVIGVQMLPILGVAVGEPSPVTGMAYDELERGAALLGEAFQLTNFLRDVTEDLERDRIYLPLDELGAFGVDEAALRADVAAGRPSTELRRALAHLVSVNRDQYRRAAPAISALPGRTRPAIAAAAASYAAILSEIERSGFDVVSRRAVVPQRRRAIHAAGALLRRG